MRSFELRCDGLEVVGDLVSEYCEEHQGVDGRGTLLYVLHRGADGRWRIRREMWNSAVKE